MNLGYPLAWGAWLAIGAMAVVTMMLRTGGFWLMGRVPLTPRIQRMLGALPGSITAAIVVPVVIKTGNAAFAAIAAVMAIMLVFCSQFLAVAGGVAAAALVRAAGWS